MNEVAPQRGLQLRSLVTADRRLELSLQEVEIPEPGADQVVVRVEGAPINPSDLSLLLGPADASEMTKSMDVSGTAERPTLILSVPEKWMEKMPLRIGKSLPGGNEGAGTVIGAGANCRHLLGKMVSLMGDMYSQYRVVDAARCMVMPDGTPAAAAAASYVNPMTALSMVETMRMEGHPALIHTTSGSALGQMLNRICLADGVPIVNVVRSAEQVAMLHGMGAKIALDSGAADFAERLTDAIAETGALIAFDATGGGTLPNTIMHAMNAALTRSADTYSRYGSGAHKQVYIYGVMERSPTVIELGTFGMWAFDSFMVSDFLQKAGPEVQARLRARVISELDTSFATDYAAEISLVEALSPDIVRAYAQRSTGGKYLINPAKGKRG